MKRKHILIAAAAICLCLVLLPYLLGLLHVRKLKNDLDNPIIDGGYENWHSIPLDDNIEIKIPDAWSLKPEEPLTICDSTGGLVVIGLKRGSCSDEQWISLVFY